MEILLSVLTTLLASIIISIIKPLKRLFYKFSWLELGTKYYYWFKKKIYVFPKKQETRVSISVLARIEKDGFFLLKSKKNENWRQDTLYKPLGGAIKITNAMERKLDKYSLDDKTRYTSKNDDFRIFKNLSNNKIIHKALYKENLNFYKNELIREISEEMFFNEKEKFDDFFSFKKNQPWSININYTEKDFSPIGHNDYVHHIIFDLKIKNQEKLNNLIKSIKKNNNIKIKFLDLKKGKENKTITSHILNIKKSFCKFKEKHIFLILKKMIKIFIKKL